MTVCFLLGYLISEKLYVLVRESLRPDDVVKISAHQVSDKVDVMEAFKRVVRREHVQHRDHVLVAKVLQKAQFAISPFSVNI